MQGEEVEAISTADAAESKPTAEINDGGIGSTTTTLGAFSASALGNLAAAGKAKAATRHLFCRWACILLKRETSVPAEVSSVTSLRLRQGCKHRKKACIPRSCYRFRSGLIAKI